MEFSPVETPVSDEGFTTFHLSHKGVELPDNPLSDGRWLLPGVAIKIHGRVIHHGLFYVGKHFNALKGYNKEPALIDPSLPVSPPTVLEGNADFFQDETLTQWPNYQALSPACRGLLLDWLASDRNFPTLPIGYVFIYFFGIERRVLASRGNEQLSGQEYAILFKELCRLRRVYGHERSFKRYCSKLLDVMLLIQPEQLKAALNVAILPPCALSFQLNLAKTVKAGEPIDAKLALRWLEQTEHYQFKTPAVRCNAMFSRLFLQQYPVHFPNGFKVKANTTTLILSYSPASAGNPLIMRRFDDLPDPSILSAPIKKLAVLADKCTLSLTPYSLCLGRKTIDKKDPGALLLLPDTLFNVKNSRMLQNAQHWALSVIQKQQGHGTLDALWQKTGLALPVAFNKKERDLLQAFADRAGFGFMPDSRLLHVKMKPGDPIFLFAREYAQSAFISHPVELGLLNIGLAALIAQIKTPTCQLSKLNVEKALQQEPTLTDAEREALMAYCHWQWRTPSKPTGLKKRLKALCVEDREMLGRVMLKSTIADPERSESEMKPMLKQCSKSFNMMGLNADFMAHTLTTLQRQQAAPWLSFEDKKDDEFILDAAVLAEHEAQTSVAQALLEGIFKEALDEDTIQSTDNNEKNRVLDEDETGLDRQHLALYTQLTQQASWTRAEAKACCQPLALLLDGAIETINDWAFDEVDAPVFEDDDEMITVDEEIVDELKGITP
jgi:hypothetical protein